MLHLHKLLSLLLLIFISIEVNAQYTYTNITINYEGNGTLCDSCTSGQLFNYYKCTSNSLLQYFTDPVPAGHIVTEIDAKVYGMFGCTTQAVIYMTVDTGVIGPSNSTLSNDCECYNCAVETPLKGSIQQPGWPGYTYAGNNTISIQVNANDVNICISQAILNITSRISNPNINDIFPRSSPIEMETNVLVYGSDFISTSNFHCQFGNYSTPATIEDYTMVYCSTPNVTVPSTLEFSVANDTLSLFGGNYTFFQQPVINYFSPTSSNATGGQNVTLFGTNFSNLTTIVCRFGVNFPVEAVYVSSTKVICINPTNFQQQSSNKGVTITFSENQVQYVSAPGVFTFYGVMPSPTASTSLKPSYSVSGSESSPSPAAALPGYTWAAIGGILIVIIICLIGGLVAMVRVLRNRSDLDPLYQGSNPNALLSAPLTSGDPNIIPYHEIKNWKQIEKGSFGVIYKASWRGTAIAVKKLPSNMSNKLLREFYQEAALMRSLRHPNILQYLGIATSAGEISICMEYMSQGSLYRLLHTESSFNRSRIKSICLDTAKGMNYLHQHNPPIIHRDLKSHNLLVDEYWAVRVCDFGLSRLIGQANATMTACGTPSWTAPEVLRNERYTTKADVYGFGIVIWEMFSRADPFPGMPPFQIVFAVGNQSLRPKLKSNWPSSWVSLITDCWAEDPQSRPSFEQIIVRLESLRPPPDDDRNDGDEY